jgi:glycosyltransferase involved in cell wall biosynthesis
MISVIIPTYNRLENLPLCLTALGMQEYREFEIIVVDDGSTDGTAEWLREKDNENGIPLKYLNAGPHQGFRAPRARNFGVANSNPDYTLALFIDSDNLMPPHILGTYADLHTQHPDCVIVGLYHFLLRMEFGVENLKNDEDFWFKLESMNYPRLPMPPDTSLKGRKDPRYNEFPDEPKVETYGADPLGLAFGMGCFSGNIAYPKHVFWDCDGFWEELIGHGGEDCDLAMTAIEKNHPFLRVKKLIGYHVWHPRYAPEVRMRQELDANIEKIDRKHKIGKYAPQPVEPPRGVKEWWQDPRLYHKEQGARLVCDSGNTYWAVRDIHRMGLATPEAVKELGFDWDDADPITDEALAEFTIEGAVGAESN